jgi:hypothetical protein
VSRSSSLLELINLLREARGLAPVDASDLMRNSAACAMRDADRDGLMYVGELLGGELRMEESGLWIECNDLAFARRLADITGRTTHGCSVLMPVGVRDFVTAFPDWLEFGDDGALRGWRYPVARPGTTDTWGRQAIDQPLLDRDP